MYPPPIDPDKIDTVDLLRENAELRQRLIAGDTDPCPPHGCATLAHVQEQLRALSRKVGRQTAITTTLVSAVMAVGVAAVNQAGQAQVERVKQAAALQQQTQQVHQVQLQELKRELDERLARLEKH